jgi:hypothetical protein
VTITLHEIETGKSKWAPYAYFAITGGDAKNSVRLIVGQLRRDGRLVAGYEYYRGGKNIKRVALIDQIPIGRAARFSISWNETGHLMLSAMDRKPVGLSIPFKIVSELIVVSGARATISSR